MIRNFDRLALLFFGAVYLAIFFADMTGPGFAFEELDEARNTCALLAGVQSDACLSFRAFSREFPINAGRLYSGAVQTYLSLPFFYAFGQNIISLRLLTVLLGLITLFLTYAVVLRWFNRSVAVLSAALLVQQPCFNLFTKIANNDTFLNFLSMLSLWCFTQWPVRRRERYLYAGAFILGVGFWAKIIFLWVLVGVVSSWALFARDHFRFTVRQYVGMCLAFCVGYLPQIYSLIVSHGELLRYLWLCVSAPVSDPSLMNINNAAIVTNLLMRWDQFRGLFGGNAFDMMVPEHEPEPSYVFTVLFIMAVVFLAFLACFHKDKPIRQRVGAVLLVFMVLFLGTIFTVSSFRTMHLFLVVPFPQIILALFLYYSYRMGISRTKGIVRLVATWVALGVLAVSFLLMLTQNVRTLRTLCANTYIVKMIEHSTAAYDVADYVMAQGMTTVYTPTSTFLIGKKISFLTGWRVDFHQLRAADMENAVKQLPRDFRVLTFGSPDAVLCRIPGDRENYEAWEAVARKYGIETVETKLFIDNSGRVNYALYHMRMPARGIPIGN